MAVQAFILVSGGIGLIVPAHDGSRRNRQYIRETEARIVEQIARIRAFDASGRSHEAMVARNLLGAVTEKRDARRIRLGAIEAVERSKGARSRVGAEARCRAATDTGCASS